jgi:hypothetical protein
MMYMRLMIENPIDFEFKSKAASNWSTDYTRCFEQEIKNYWPSILIDKIKKNANTQLIDPLEAGGAERMAVNYANALADEIDFFRFGFHP